MNSDYIAPSPGIADPQPNGAAPAKRILPRHRVPAHLARRFHQICLGVSAELLRPENLGPIEYAVLAAIDDRPGFDQRGLAFWLGIDPTTTGQIVDRLATNGLIDRAVDPEDRRARILSLTPAGTHLRQRLRMPLLAAQHKIMASLSSDEQATLIGLLTRIVDNNDVYARPGNGRRKPRRKAEASGIPPDPTRLPR